MDLILPLSDSRATLDLVGGKGASLARLSQAGLPVPAGFTIATPAYRLFVSQNEIQPAILACLKNTDPNDPATFEAASESIRRLFSAAPIPASIAAAIAEAHTPLAKLGPVAVRSSATAEDLPEASFAGQQDTYLNISGEQAVLEATRNCWASLWTARAIAYRARRGIDPDQVALAVVIQSLVAAEKAGVLFTANPLNGRRRQILINAAWGLGEAIVGGLVTPDTYLIDKSTGQCISQEIADKQVMTVRVPGGTLEQPVPEHLRRASVLDQPALQALTGLALQIETLYGMPMDIEWALARGQIAILQARPITALPEEPSEPVPAPPLEWRLPEPKGRYMRGSIADFMPAPLTPLFESMVVPGMNQALFERMSKIGSAPLQMYRRFFTTINHFAYTSAKFSARDWLEMIVHLLPALPRLVRDGLSYWQVEALPRYRETTARWRGRDLSQLSPAELIQGIQEVFGAAAYHLATLQVSTLGIAAGAEGVYTAVYDKWIKRPDDPAASILVLGFDSIPIRAEKALFDLAQKCLGQPALAQYLQQAPTPEILKLFQTRATPNPMEPSAWADFCADLQAFLDRYGYAIYNFDFFQPLPQDDPGPMLETIKMILSGQGKNPYERQQAAIRRREAAHQAIQTRTKGLKSSAFRKTLGWAQKYGPLREDSIAEIGLGYPVIRALIHELGTRFVAAGLIAQPNYVYWLTLSEIQASSAALTGSQPAESRAALIEQRQAEWKQLKQISPPAQLPGKIKILGMNSDALMGIHGGNESGEILRGLGASAGQVTAIARVLHGPEDFYQMHPGDVLVAPMTTPAWTPLFAMASAVVTDIGGPLSHGSIVAREYGIPAVLGTGLATRRIQSGQRVMVDGTQGIVKLLPDEA